MEGDCWVVAGGKVYDVSMLMMYHIMESNVFLNTGGRDCVEEEFFTHPTYKKEWNMWLIGVLKK